MSNLSIRLDDNLKNQADQILAGYGLSTSQAVKLFLNQVVATGKVPLSFDFQANSQAPQELTAKALKIIEQNTQEQQQGISVIYNSFDEMMADLAK